MRLIDADKLIKELTIKAVSKDAHIISIANAVVNLVNNQPTFYSVDEVVEELEKQRNIIFQDTDSEIKIVRANAWDKIDVLNKAIEIVKQGH